MSEADFQAVPEVEIDTGVFKYVLIRLYRFLETEKVSQCAYDVNAASAKISFLFIGTMARTQGKRRILCGDITLLSIMLMSMTGQRKRWTSSFWLILNPDLQITKVGLDCECLGGGRIEHKEADKYIKVTFPFLWTAGLELYCLSSLIYLGVRLFDGLWQG